jgi:hypothetical protein
LNGIPVEEHLDLPSSIVVAPEYQTNFTFYVKLNHRNDVEKIYRIGVTEKEKRPQYCVFDSAINGKEKFVSCDRNELLEFQSAANVFEMQLVSVTTLRTEHKDSKQHHDHTDIVRDGRCYDPPIKYTSMVTDGYSNHIYNRISYVSKRLNKAIGVGPNKRVAKPSNMLTSAILDTQKKTTAKYRKWAREDAEKNSSAKKEAEKKASENDNVILREIPVASPALPPDVMGSFFRFQSGDILVDGAPFTEVVVPVPSSKKRSREESFQPFTLQEFGRFEEMNEPLPAATVPQCLHADEEPAVSMVLEEVAVEHDSLEAVEDSVENSLETVEDSVKYCIVSGENDVVVSIPSNEVVEVTPEEVVEVTREEVVEVTSGEVVEATSGEVVEVTHEEVVLENEIEDVVADVLKNVVERFVSDCMDVVDDAFERQGSLESPSPSVPPPLPPVCNVHASRQTILQSVNCMLDLIADPAFNREDGYLFTDFVNAYLHK